MQAGVTDFLWSIEDIVMMVDTNSPEKVVTE